MVETFETPAKAKLNKICNSEIVGEAPDMTCSICISMLSVDGDDKIVKLPKCGHLFHE